MATVLVIDDSELVRQTLTSALTGAGFDVVQGVDGDEGLKKLLNTPDIDAVITDYNMPGYDGVTMLRKALQELKELKFPIFFLTAQSPESIRSKAQELGEIYWVPKPVKTEFILSVLNKILAKKKASSPED